MKRPRSSRTRKSLTAFVVLAAFLLQNITGILPIPSGLPAFAEEAGRVTIVDQDFEEDYAPLTSGAELKLADSEGREGSMALQVTPPQEWNVVAVDLSDRSAGEVIDISLWFRPTETGNYVLQMYSKLTSGQEDWKWLHAESSIAADTWKNFTASYTVPENATQLTLQFQEQGGNETYSVYYLDDFKITVTGSTPPVTGDKLLETGFEEGTTPFILRDNAVIEQSDAQARTGDYALKVTNSVSNEYSGTSLVLTEAPINAVGGEIISIEAYFYTDTPGTYNLMTEPNYQTVASVIITEENKNQWHRLSGSHTIPAAETDFRFNIQRSAALDYVFYLDDVIVTKEGSAETGGNGYDPTLTPIKDVYANDFLIGSIYTPNDLDTSKDKTKLLLQHFDTITPENIMKPAYMQPSEGTFSYANTYEMLDFAVEQNLNVVGHTFVWHSQSGWMQTASNLGTRDEALAKMESHIKTIAENYISTYGTTGPIVAFDVVNEAFDDGGTITDGNWKALLRDSAWKQAIGTDYLAYAFTYARQYLPENVKLYYNDYNLDNSTKADAVYYMVKEFLEEDIPIDGIGMQSHYSVNTSIGAVKASIEKFASLGVEISVTELDVGANVTNGQLGLKSTEAIAQAQQYAQLFQLYKANSDSIARVTFWGSDDSSSWRSESAPCLFSQNLTAKLAYQAVIDPDGFLEAYPLAEKPAPKEASAARGTPADMDDPLWAAASEIAVDHYLDGATSGATGIGKVLWDGSNLYLRIAVTDDELDASGAQDHQQDSVEVFIDLSNDKSASYISGDDYQIRVNYQGAVSGHAYPDMTSETAETEDGYVVFITLPVSTPLLRSAENLADGDEIGFDLQVNDCAGGTRQSVATFNESKGMAWSTTEDWGVLRLSDYVYYGSFETGKDGFEVHDVHASVAVTDEKARTGVQSLKVYERGDKESYYGAELNVASSGIFEPHGQYSIEAYVLATTAGKHAMTLTIDHCKWPTLATVNVTQAQVDNGEWVKLSAVYNAPAVFDYITLNFQTDDEVLKGKDFYIDDVKIVKTGERIVEGEGYNPDLAPLKDVYTDDFLLGTIYTPIRDMFPDSARTALLANHFNAITPENIMKPYAMQPEQDTFSYDQVDTMIAFAVENDLEVIGHTLVWHGQSAWMENVANLVDRETAIEIMRKHIQAIATRYKDEIVAWDVVNEAFDGTRSGINENNWRNYLRNTGATTSSWRKVIGDDYLEYAFTFARQYMPGVKLYYNDYSLNDSNKADAVYYMAKHLKTLGIIDGIGMQSHYDLNTTIDSVETSIKKFTSLGLEVSVTELDIGVGNQTASPALNSDLFIKQGQKYAQLMNLYKKYSDSIARVTFWGIDDDTSWRTNNYACLFSENLTAKPAYFAVLDPDGFLEDHPVGGGTTEPILHQRTTATYTAVSPADAEDSVWANAEAIDIGTLVEGAANTATTGTAYALWDEAALYLLVKVDDDTPDVTASAAYQQDSVEVFISQNNNRSTYKAGDYQIRVNRNNVVSGSGSYPGLVTTASGDASKYAVMLTLPNANTLGKLMTFDVQVNGCASGARKSVTTFNDPTGLSYNTSVHWGEILLVPVPGTTQYNINADATANGTVTADAAVSAAGLPVQITTVPDTGYQLKADSIKVYKDGDSTTAVPVTAENAFIMPPYDVEITAEFIEIQKYAVTTQNTSNGSITADKTQAAAGETVKVTVQAEEGYRLKTGSLIVNSVAITGTTFVMPEKAATITAEFEAVYSITRTAAGNGSVSIGKSEAAESEVVNLFVSPGSGYTASVLVYKTGDNSATTTVTAGAGGNNSFIMPGYPVVVEVVFHGIYAIAVDTEIENGTVTTNAATAASGSEVTITLTADQGYQMVEGSLKVHKTGNVGVLVPIAANKFTMPAYDVTVTAAFEAVSAPDPVYTITVANTQNGSITASTDSAQEGTEIQLTVTPDAGYQLQAGTLTVNGSAITGTTFPMPAKNVTVTGIFEATSPQVKHHEKYINGYVNGTFKPNGIVTRAEAVTMMYNLLGMKAIAAKQTFTDVSTKSWYYEAVSALSAAGIINGYSDGSFKPNKAITRAEFITMAVRFANVKGSEMKVVTFTDVNKNTWYYRDLVTAVSNNWVKGYPNGTFQPAKGLARGEAVTVLNRVLGRALDTGMTEEKLASQNPFSDVSVKNWAYRAILEAAVSHNFIPGENGNEVWQ